jgi:hypothetical protein
MSLLETEAAAAAAAKRPDRRVSLQDIEANIAVRIDLSGAEIARWKLEAGAATASLGAFTGRESLNVLSVCLLVVFNGFVVIGKSAPADPDNFDAELGCKLAYEDAVRQLWPLMGYHLREQLGGLDVETDEDDE